MNQAPESTDWEDAEKRLEPEYVSFFTESMGMPEEIARDLFKAIAADQKEAARREGTDRLPESFGYLLLEWEKNDDRVRDAFAPKRAEGVTDEDIAFWWNMHDLERRMICKIDEMNRILLFETFVSDGGMTEKEAARWVAKRCPIYGDPEHLVLDTDDDRPLPFEMKPRINRYLMERSEADPDGLRKESETSTSLNALLRKAVRRSEL